MKNFYDSTVIKPTLKLDVVITLTPVGQCPCIVLVNDTPIFDKLLTDTTILQHGCPLTEPLTVSIIITRQHPEAVIVGITIDGYPVIPLYQSHAIPPTDYLDTNGTWTLTIPNFYQWYHEITGQGWII
jgi:hypothetical protein